MQNPLVSIVIPVYNGENYLKEAIDSALKQSYKNIEVLVINDGSTDKTEEICLSYGNKIHYFKKKNGGVSSALNLGIKEMKGKYFSWLSHDDLYTKNKILDQVKCLDNLGNDAIFISKKKFIDKNGKEIMDFFVPFSEKALSYKEAIKRILTGRVFDGCSLLIPKDYLIKAGGFNENLRFCQDVFMWIKLFLNHHIIVNVDSNGVCNRMHDKQVTLTRRDLFYNDMLYVTKNLYKPLVHESDKEYNFIYYLAKHLAKHKCKDTLKWLLNKQKKDKQLSFKERLIIKIYTFYGRIRPLIRNLYYLVKK